MTPKNRSIAFIGGGHITEIIMGNLIRTQKVIPDQLVVSDPNRERLQALHNRYSHVMARDNSEAVKMGEIIFINVLPQVVEKVVGELQEIAFPLGKVLVSLAAGIPMKKYAPLGEKLSVVRALPNPPSQIGWGMTALAFNEHVTSDQKEDVIDLFSSLGKYVILNEETINVVTALSSPAPVYMFFEALIDGGVRAGMDRGVATEVAYQTIVGSMEVWKQRRVSPSDLMSEASTPGGISVEILFTLDHYAFRAAINEAIHNGTLKAREFSRVL